MLTLDSRYLNSVLNVKAVVATAPEGPDSVYCFYNSKLREGSFDAIVGIMMVITGLMRAPGQPS